MTAMATSIALIRTAAPWSSVPSRGRRHKCSSKTTHRCNLLDTQAPDEQRRHSALGSSQAIELSKCTYEQLSNGRATLDHHEPFNMTRNDLFDRERCHSDPS